MVSYESKPSSLVSWLLADVTTFIFETTRSSSTMAFNIFILNTNQGCALLWMRVCFDGVHLIYHVLKRQDFYHHAKHLHSLGNQPVPDGFIADCLGVVLTLIQRLGQRNSCLFPVTCHRSCNCHPDRNHGIQKLVAHREFANR